MEPKLLQRILNPSWLSSFLSVLFMVGQYTPTFAAPNTATLADSEVRRPFKKINNDRFEGCNWNVQYKGRVYDLTPMTKISLSRPLDTDIRNVLERDPDAKIHMQELSRQNQLAKGHTLLATFFISSFFAARIMNSRETDQGQKDTLGIVSLASLFFFAKAGYESYRSVRRSEDELVSAINAFNTNSSFQIEATEKTDSPFLDFALPEDDDAKKN